MSKELTKSEAIKEINNGKIVVLKATDGHVEFRKIKNSLYEVRGFEGEEEIEVLNGDFRSLMKSLNRKDIEGLYLK